jgi:hypothetical protein
MIARARAGGRAARGSSRSCGFVREKFRDAVRPRIPACRWGRPDDFGGLVVYLMSDASAYHTGDSMVVDGGYWIF